MTVRKCPEESHWGKGKFCQLGVPDNRISKSVGYWFRKHKCLDRRRQREQTVVFVIVILRGNPKDSVLEKERIVINAALRFLKKGKSEQKVFYLLVNWTTLAQEGSLCAKSFDSGQP